MKNGAENTKLLIAGLYIAGRSAIDIIRTFAVITERLVPKSVGLM